MREGPTSSCSFRKNTGPSALSRQPSAGKAVLQKGPTEIFGHVARIFRDEAVSPDHPAMAIDRQVPETSGPFASTAKPKSNNNNNYLSLAEGEGFEPSIRLLTI